MNTETFEHNFEVGTPAELVVKNIHGRVLVVPGEAGTIRVKEIRYPDSGNADLIKVEVSQDASGKVRVEASLKDPIFGILVRRPQQVDFEIEAPAETNLKVNMVSGPIAVKGLNGQISLKSVSGSISAKDLSGELRLTSVSGKITGANLAGPAEVDMVSGKVDLRGCDFSSLRHKGVSGKVIVETNFGAGPYTLEAVSGAINLVVPSEINCEVDAGSVSGRFSTDLPVSQSSVGRSHWRVRVGNGGTTVRMKTVSGKMSLLSGFNAVGREPGEVSMDSKQREEVLTRLSEGEIDVDQAIQELGN